MQGEGFQNVKPEPREGMRPWDRLLANIRLRELFALVGNLLVAVSIFLPWIYGFSAPSGPNYQITLVAAPDLFSLALHSGYGFLLAIPVGLALGIAFALTPVRTSKLLKVMMIGLAFVTCMVANFIFGLQYGSAIGLVVDGNYVSYSITLGLGSRVLGLGNFLYLVSLFIAVIAE
jgi:hypothetical protein